MSGTDWSEVISGSSKPAKQPSGVSNGPTDWTDVIGSKPARQAKAEPETAAERNRKIGDQFQAEKRFKRAYAEFYKNGMDVFMSEEAAMALFDISMIGQPTFGDKSLTFEGRDKVKAEIRKGKHPLQATQEYIEQHHGPSALKIYLDLANEIASPFMDRFKGVAIAEAFPFQGLLERLPSVIRAGGFALTQQLPKALSGDPTKEDWRSNLEEIEQIAEQTAATRAADGASRLLQYFVPVIGTWTARSDFARVVDRQVELGLPEAIKAEVLDNFKALNVLEPGIDWDERLVRTLGLGLAGFGVAHGAKKAGTVWQTLKEGGGDLARLDHFGFGKVMTKAMEAAFREDSYLTSLIDGRDTMRVSSYKKDPSKAVEAVDQVSGKVKDKIADAVKTVIAQGGNEAAFWHKVQQRHSEEPDRDILDIAQDEAGKPEWDHLTPNQTQSTEKDAAYKKGQLKSVNRKLAEKYSRGVEVGGRAKFGEDTVNVVGLAKTENGTKYFAIENRQEPVPESDLTPILSIGGKNVSVDEVERAAKRARVKNTVAIAEPSKLASPRGGLEMANMLSNMFDLNSKDAYSVAMIYQARAEAFAAHTGNSPADWFADRFVGFGNERTIVDPELLSPLVKIADGDGAVSSARLVELSKDGTATVRLDDGTETTVQREAIVEGLPSDRTSMSRIDAGALMRRPDKTVVRVEVEDYGTRYFELTGEAKKTYDQREAEYREAVNKSRSGSLLANARLRKLSDEFGKFKRDITGTTTKSEKGARAAQEDAYGAGKRVETPEGPGTSLGANFGRIRVKLDGEQTRVESFSQADLAAVAPEGSRVASNGVREIGHSDLKNLEQSPDILGEQVPPPGVKGWVDFVENGRALIRAFKASDPSTFVHELGHVWRRELYMGSEFTPAERQAAERFAGAENGNWTPEAEEKWARAVEVYLRDNKAPTIGLRKAFKRLKAWMRHIYGKAEQSSMDLEISPEVREVFDRFLGKDVDQARRKKERQEAKTLSEEEARMEEERAALMMIDPDDPRIDLSDPFGDIDEVLVVQIQSKLGGGPDDPRTPSEIIEDARRATLESELFDDERRELESSDESPILYINEMLYESKDRTQFSAVVDKRWALYKGQDGKLRADQRQAIDLYTLDHFPEHLLSQAEAFLKSGYRAPEYFLASGAQLSAVKKGDKPTLLRADEYMEQEWGPSGVVTKDFLSQWKASLLAQSGKADDAGRLYQTERLPAERLLQREDFEDSERGGIPELRFNAEADEMTMWAAAVLEKVDGNVDELKKLIRKEYGLDALQALEIVRRIGEFIPASRIVEVYEEAGGSYRAIVQMLIEEFPELPKSRYSRATERALRMDGRPMATVPSMTTDKRTKRKVPVEYKDILVIGGEDVLVPAETFNGLETWTKRLPRISASQNMERFLEQIADRNHSIIDFTVRNRQEGVTNLTTHLQEYRNQLKGIYGDLIHDQEARELIMFIAEEKGRHDTLAIEAYRPVVREIVTHVVQQSAELLGLFKGKARKYAIDWGEFTAQQSINSYEMFIRLLDEAEVRQALERVARDFADSGNFDRFMASHGEMLSIDRLYESMKETRRPDFTLDDLKARRPSDWQKIQGIADWHRSEYDELYSMVNAVRIRFGLGEIPYRKDYMTHIREQAAEWERITGIDPMRRSRGNFIKRKSLFNPHALERLGEKSQYDSLKNFESYLDVSLRQIHLTEPAVRHRTIARTIMRKDLENEMTNLYQRFDLAANELAGQASHALELDNLIGNQRTTQTVTAWVNFFTGRVGANAILGNMQTALMQTAQLPIAAGMLGPQNILAGAMQRVSSLQREAFDPSNGSQFLTRRYGFEGRLALDWHQKFNKFLARPMEFIEEHTARTIWTSAKVQAERAGKSEAEAFDYAEKITERIIGGRAIGEKSPLFESNVGKLLLQFQYEVSNFNQLLRHDLGYSELEGRELTRKELIARAAVMAVSIYAANTVYQYLFGRRPIPDAIETATDMIGIAVNPDIEGFDKVGRLVARPIGEIVSATAGGSTSASLVMDDMNPLFGTGLSKRELFGDSELGQFQGGVPITTSLRRAFKGDSPGEFAWNMTTILGLPGGGAQLNKTIDGLSSIVEGGVKDKRGKMMFKVSGLDVVRAPVFGPFATQSGQEWLKERREKESKSEN